MRVLIRTDLSRETGMGNAVRCRALARALAMAGVDVAFVTTTPALAEFVAPFSCGAYDAVALCKGDILVFDTKTDLPSWPWRMKLSCDGYKLVCVDTVPTDDVWHLVIAPVAHWDNATVTRLCADFGERFLYGWDYVMLDDAVTAQEPLPYGLCQAGPIVFCAGGSDPSGALQQMYDWTTDLVLEPPANLVFVQGMYAPKLRWSAHAMPHALVDGTLYHQMVRQAALVVGLVGCTVYEAIWYRTPMVCYAHTPENAQAAARLEATSHGALQCPVPRELAQGSREMFLSTLVSMADEGVRQAMHQASAGLLDGHGMQRVADAILRYAALKDGVSQGL